MKKGSISQTFILDIKKDNSFFYSDEYCDSNVDNIDNYIMIEKSNDSIIIHDQIELFTIKTFFNKKLKWNLTNKFIVKDGIKLFEGITNYNDRKWTVYYNPEIPISDGPFIFTGLPGMVYEVKSDDLSIEIISLDYKENRNCYIIEEENVVDFKDYKKYNSNFLQTFQESINNSFEVKSDDLSDILLKSVKKDLLREFL